MRRKKQGKKTEKKIEELEQTLFELRGEIGAGRHVLPGVRVLSLSMYPAQEWADLRQAALDRLKEEIASLLQRLHLLIFLLQSQSQSRYQHQRQHDSKGGGGGTPSSTGKLVSRLRAKSATRRRTPSKGVSRGALGDIGRQTRLLR